VDVGATIAVGVAAGAVAAAAEPQAVRPTAAITVPTMAVSFMSSSSHSTGPRIHGYIVDVPRRRSAEAGRYGSGQWVVLLGDYVLAVQKKLTFADMTRAIDQHTLLFGEDPRSLYLEDALHWLQVYAELIQFKASVLEVADIAAEAMSETARRDVAFDQDLLRAQADRYRIRRQFWSARAADLAADDSRIAASG
jgi:hypothetical protein